MQRCTLGIFNIRKEVDLHALARLHMKSVISCSRICKETALLKQLIILTPTVIGKCNLYLIRHNEMERHNGFQGTSEKLPLTQASQVDNTLMQHVSLVQDSDGGKAAAADCQSSTFADLLRKQDALWFTPSAVQYPQPSLPQASNSIQAQQPQVPLWLTGPSAARKIHTAFDDNGSSPTRLNIEVQDLPQISSNVSTDVQGVEPQEFGSILNVHGKTYEVNRQHIVQQIFQAMSLVPALRERPTTYEFARTMECQAYKKANSQEEYFLLLSDELYSLHKMVKKSEETTRRQLEKYGVQSNVALEPSRFQQYYCKPFIDNASSIRSSNRTLLPKVDLSQPSQEAVLQISPQPQKYNSNRPVPDKTTVNEPPLKQPSPFFHKRWKTTYPEVPSMPLNQRLISSNLQHADFKMPAGALMNLPFTQSLQRQQQPSSSTKQLHLNQPLFKYQQGQWLQQIPPPFTMQHSILRRPQTPFKPQFQIQEREPLELQHQALFKLQSQIQEQELPKLQPQVQFKPQSQIQEQEPLGLQLQVQFKPQSQIQEPELQPQVQFKPQSQIQKQELPELQPQVQFKPQSQIQEQELLELQPQVQFKPQSQIQKQELPELQPRVQFKPKSQIQEQEHPEPQSQQKVKRFVKKRTIALKTCKIQDLDSPLLSSQATSTSFVNANTRRSKLSASLTSDQGFTSNQAITSIGSSEVFTFNPRKKKEKSDKKRKVDKMEIKSMNEMGCESFTEDKVLVIRNLPIPSTSCEKSQEPNDTPSLTTKAERKAKITSTTERTLDVSCHST